MRNISYKRTGIFSRIYMLLWPAREDTQGDLAGAVLVAVAAQDDGFRRKAAVPDVDVFPLKGGEVIWDDDASVRYGTVV